jgi:probable HAF family extracellular repeat protein
MRTRAMSATTVFLFLLVSVPYHAVITADSGARLEVLATLGGSWSSAAAINGSGTVVGAAAAASGVTRAYALRPDDPRLNDLDTPPDAWSSAYAINASGVVVGAHMRPDGGTRAFVADPHAGVTEDLGTFGGNWTVAYGVNASGTIVGGSRDTAGAMRAFRYRADVGMQSLGTLGGNSSQAFAINDDGIVVGESRTLAGQMHAFRWAGGTMEDLGTLGGAISRARAINASGLITGNAATPTGDEHGFLFEPGVGMVSLGAPAGGFASGEGINGKGHVVGWWMDADYKEHAFLWTPETGLVDLNTLVALPAGDRLAAAYGINDDGQIVGYGVFGGQLRAFRLTLPAEAGGGTDVTPPVIDALSASPDVLWPPKGELVPITVSVSATDDSGEAPACTITGVSSSEPDLSGEVGDQPGDIVLVDALQVQVRAERLEAGSGRVYTLRVACVDGSGNAAADTTVVRVPKSNGGGKAKVRNKN